MFPPVESQVIFLSKETPIVSVGLRTAEEVSYTNQNKTAWKSWTQPIQPIKKPVRTLSIFTSMAFVKDANGISFKNRLEGHINWRKVRNFIIIWMDESIYLVKMTRLRMGKSVHRWEVVIPAFVRLRIFTPFCFGSCMKPQQFVGLH